jgi:hypothetical protein
MAATNDPSVSRRIVEVNPDKGLYRVDLTITPNGNTKAVQFTDEIPEGFLAHSIENHAAKFSFENNAVMFSWDHLDGVEAFTISYMVRSGIPGPAPVINGELTYGETDAGTSSARKTEVVDISEIESEAVDATMNPSPGNQQSITADNSQKAPAPSYMPVTQKGITFKVQISATQRSSTKNNSWFISRYHINSNVELTYHEGWKKYLIGEFDGYEEANNFRTVTQEKVSDAFIVAYQNGVRIPVAEAIKIKTYNQ